MDGCLVSVLLKCSVVTTVPLFIPCVLKCSVVTVVLLLFHVLLKCSGHCYSGEHCLFRVLLKCSVRCYSGEQHGGLSHGSAACSVCLCHQHLHRCSLQQRPVSGIHRQGRHCAVQLHLSDVLWNRRLQRWSSCVVVSSRILCGVLITIILMMQSCMMFQ